MHDWTPADLPSLAGKTFAITGGNSGLGLELAKILVGKGARVVITSRRRDKAEAALSVIRQTVAGAEVDWVQLDLVDPGSIEAAAGELRERCPSLDAIVNNAGVMQTPLIRTDEGFELQMATNHLGHFRLNSRLFEHLEACGSRVVVVSSIAHKYGRLSFRDMMYERRRYDSTAAYMQSKLANLMYAFELERRLRVRGSSVSAIACHPGYAATNLQKAGVGMDGGSWFWRGIYAISDKVMAQSATRGAYPLALAAAEPKAQGGVYYGPRGPLQMRGPVGVSHVARHARDEAIAKRLWEHTESLVGPFFAD